MFSHYGSSGQSSTWVISLWFTSFFFQHVKNIAAVPIFFVQVILLNCDYWDVEFLISEMHNLNHEKENEFVSPVCLHVFI